MILNKKNMQRIFLVTLVQISMKIRRYNKYDYVMNVNIKITIRRKG